MKSLAITILFPICAFTQSQIDYNTQIKNKPITIGTSVPVSCTYAGNQFFNTATNILYICSGTTYSAIGNSIGPAGLTLKSLNNVRFSSQFTGSDCGAQINNAYADLPATGGKIIVDTSCSFSTPIVFGVNHKPALLEGFPADAINLTYTGLTGTAILLNYGMDHAMGKGIRDLTITGPGHATNTIGVMIGGTNGGESTTIRDFKIQSFGTNVQFGNNTWIVQLEQGMIRDGNINVLFPSTLTSAGENIQWNHVTFADGPNPPTNSVWLQTGEHKMTDCSFDNAQLSVGNLTATPGSVWLSSPHFENPNYVLSPAYYDFVTIGSHVANDVAMSMPYFEYDNPSPGTLSRSIKIDGGRLTIIGANLFTPGGTLTAFVNANNKANINIIAYNDLSGNTATLVNGNSTGYLYQLPGATPAGLPSFNNVIGPNAGTNKGGVYFDVTGSIKASGGQLVSSIATGTPPFIVASTSPVNGLFANPTTYQANGTQIITQLHMVFGQAVVSGTATVTLVGGAIFTSLSSYSCIANDTSASLPVRIQYTSGSQFIISSTGTNVTYLCEGF